MKKYEDELPREKLMEKGVESLQNYELLALLLRTGNKNSNVIDFSKEIISHFKNLRELSKATFEELCEINGIGQSKASMLIASLELSKRIRVEYSKPSIKVLDPKSIFEYFVDELGFLSIEKFYIVLLDTKNNIISKELISVGDLNSSIVHPREVFKIAIKKSANSIILVHNHPSNEVEPSVADKNITKKLIECGELLGIKVLDHIVIGADKYYSFKEYGII